MSFFYRDLMFYDGLKLHVWYKELKKTKLKYYQNMGKYMNKNPVVV